ncbi:hypothetical protein [Thiomonas sp. FB-Cd]|uniref:hypothetical protein n=1 Tax=Thiomonas sp. FB-Cd TaxID=1158292 RepID=UPI0004DFA737|nr:hypothetical protein [Thiomonas sp. FB-Cd]
MAAPARRAGMPCAMGLRRVSAAFRIGMRHNADGRVIELHAGVRRGAGTTRRCQWLHLHSRHRIHENAQVVQKVP